MEIKSTMISAWPRFRHWKLALPTILWREKHLGGKKTDQSLENQQRRQHHNLINEHYIKTTAEWNTSIDITIKNQLIREFGLNVDSYVPPPSLSLPSAHSRLLQQTLQWPMLHPTVQSLHRVDSISFLREWDCVYRLLCMGRMHQEWDTLRSMHFMVCQGPTNAGKFFHIDADLHSIQSGQIPRERDNSRFHLDQLPEASAALFVEPIITPTNVYYLNVKLQHYW